MMATNAQEERELFLNISLATERWDDVCVKVKEHTDNLRFLQSLTISEVLEMIDIARIEQNER